MKNLKIEYVSKEQLKPYANNAKIHTGEQVEQIKKSIREFGFNDPIAIWHENEVVEGHGRLLAVMEMDEIESVPVIRLDSLTDEQRKAYMLVHNKLTMNTDFDLDLLSLEIQEITGIDLTDIGFNEAEILELTVDDDIEYESPFEEKRKETEIIPEPRDYNGFNREHENKYEKTQQDFHRELDQYEQNANNSLTTKRVILIYRNEIEAEFIKKILGIKSDAPLNVVYDVHEIMEEMNAEPKK